MASVEVLVGPERRRRWSTEQKQAIVAAAFASGAVLREVAHQADVTSSLIYRWRRDLRGAANAFLAKIREAASARLGCAAQQVELVDGYARAPGGRSLAFGELAADGLCVTTAFGNDNRLTYIHGSAAARVAVDPGTGDVELLDCLVVEDVGRIVNPLTVHGQAIGGLVQGWAAPSSSISSMTQAGSCSPAASPTT